MEDVTDVVFRRLCRRLGATVCMTEFVNVEQLLRGAASARRKVALADDDQLTGIQIYGADPQNLAAAAQVAEADGGRGVAADQDQHGRYRERRGAAQRSLNSGTSGSQRSASRSLPSSSTLPMKGSTSA